jgi:gp16 family phage-associated protein
MQISPILLEEARVTFFRKGASMAEWARANNFRQDLVYAVLSGRSKASRGESHRIAVELGLKSRDPSKFTLEETKM